MKYRWLVFSAVGAAAVIAAVLSRDALTKSLAPRDPVHVPAARSPSQPAIEQLDWQFIIAELAWTYYAMAPQDGAPTSGNRALALLAENVEKDEAASAAFRAHEGSMRLIVDNAALYSKAVGFAPKQAFVQVLVDEDGSRCVGVATLMLSTEFNSLVTTERTRAVKIFRENMEPALTHTSPPAEGVGAVRVIIGITYGVRDFSGRANDHRPETLVCVANLTDVDGFSSGKMTEDDFVQKCQIFLAAENSKKRISLKLD